MNMLLAAIRIGCLATAGLLIWSMAHIDLVHHGQYRGIDPHAASFAWHS